MHISSSTPCIFMCCGSRTLILQLIHFTPAKICSQIPHPTPSYTTFPAFSQTSYTSPDTLVALPVSKITRSQWMKQIRPPRLDFVHLCESFNKKNTRKVYKPSCNIALIKHLYLSGVRLGAGMIIEFMWKRYTILSSLFMILWGT